MPQLSPALFPFLKELRENNAREWFLTQTDRYKPLRTNFEETVEALLLSIGSFENMTGIEAKKCLFRLNRDVRFSANKAPYKAYFSASFAEGGRKSGRMDYYVHVEDQNSFVGGGMYAPTAEQLSKFRQEIDYNAAILKGIIDDPNFVLFFGSGEGEVLKTTPKGYPKDHPDIDLLRKKQLFFMRKFSNEEVLSTTFVAEVTETCRRLKPYLDFLNETFMDS